MLRRSFLRLGVLGGFVSSVSLDVFRTTQARLRFTWERFISQPTFQRPLNRETVVLEIATAPIRVLGKSVDRGCIRQLNGQRGYTTSQAKGVNVELINRLLVPSSVHWHGLILPNAMDGVPFARNLRFHLDKVSGSTTRWCKTALSGCIRTMACRPRAMWLSHL